MVLIMGFVEDWNEAADNDPYWQLQELMEDDLDLAEAIWDASRIYDLAIRRLTLKAGENPELLKN